MSSDAAGGAVHAGVRASSTILAGAGLVALTNAAVIALTLSVPPRAAGGASLRLAHHAFDLAETVGVGGLVAVAVGVASAGAYALGLRRGLHALSLAAASLFVWFVLGEYLRIFAAHLFDGVLAGPVYVTWIVATAMGVAWSPLLASSLGAVPRLRHAPLAISVLALGANHLVHADDYADLHGVFAVGAAMLGGAALAPALERRARRLAGGWVGRAGLGLVALGGVLGLGLAPPDAVRGQLFRQPTAIASWTLATILWRRPEPRAPVVVPDSPWLHDRTADPPIPPTSPALLPADAVIVLLTLDALRGDVVADPRNDALFPTLARLKREGVYFPHASSSGSQTETSFATVFSGRYASELRWSWTGTGWTFHPHPVADTFPRLPELLGARGVDTENFAGIAFLAEGYGVTRGFRDETKVILRKNSAPGFRLIVPLEARLKKSGAGPLFLSAHVIDTHAPYGRPKPGQSDYERYLATIEGADRLVERVLHALEEHCGDRWALFLGADHGEAFGEHESYEHGKTLYEELLHVPLIARSPAFAARTVDARVGLVDLGPTLLDLFGADTPATFEGQSLVPFLAGGTVNLTRPLIAEGRLRQALTLPDGLKVIDDPRRKVVEVYDLEKDPGETVNLFDLDPGRSDAALAELRAFFAVHAWREPGYDPPYKP